MSIRNMKVSKRIPPIVLNTLEEYSDVRLKVDILPKLEQLNMTLSDLSCLTGIRYASLHDLIHLKRTSINLAHLLCIIKVLRITDISEVLKIEMSEETYNEFERDREKMKQLGGLTYKLARRLEENSEYIEEKKKQPLK